MSYKLNQSWKILITLDDTTPNYFSEHKLFVAESGTSFLRKIGGRMENFAISPIVLRPTIVFNNAISKLNKELGIVGKKSPYKKDNNILSFTIHAYFEKYIVLTINYIDTNVISFESLKKITNLSYYPEINNFTLAIAGLIKSGNYKNFRPLKTLPTLRCTSIEIIDVNSTLVDDCRLVESLSGHTQPVKSIIDDVLKRNKDHQLNEALTLIDKQGVIQQIPYNFIGKKEAERKYNSCCNIFELMMVISASIKNESLSKNHIYFNAISELVNSPEKVVYSFTAIRTIEQFVKDFHLPRALRELKEKSDSIRQAETAITDKKKGRLSLKDGWNQFYASKEFFGIILGACVAGATSILAIIWKFF